MDSKEDPFVYAVAALVASTPDEDISQVLSTIKAGTEDKSKRKECVFKLARRNGALERLVTRLPNDEDNMSSILSILADLFLSSFVARDAVRRFGVLEHVSKILKTRQHDEIIINRCLRLVANLCRHNERLANDVVMNESTLNIIEIIVRIPCLVLEEDVPSKTTVMLSLSSLHNILKNMYAPERIVKDYGVVKALGCMMVKFIDDWKTSKKNHDALTIVMKVLELCSKLECRNIFFELKNTGGGDAMLLLSVLIVMPAVSLMVKNIVLNLQKLCIHYSDVPFNDIYGKLIEKLQDPNAYTDGTENQQYTIFLQILCQLSKAKTLTESLIVTVTVSLLNALQSHVRPTEVSLKNCKLVIATLRQQHFSCCLRLMLDSGILSILSNKLDWIFGVENQLDLHHRCLLTPLSRYAVYEHGGESEDEDETHHLSRDVEKVFERQFYGNLNTSHAEFNAMRRRRKRKRSPSPRRARDYILSPTRSLSPAASPAASTSGTSDQETDDKLDDMSSVYSDVEEDELLAVKSEPKRAESKKSVGSTRMYSTLAWEIVNLIKCFANLNPIALELGTSDLVYKLLLFFLPKNESFKPLRIKKIIKNIIKKPENLINLLMQTRFIYAAHKLFIPKHNSYCLRCVDLFAVGHMIMTDLTKVVEGTSGKGDIAHNLYRANPTVKERLIIAVPFFSEKMSTLNNLMVKCGGLNVLIDAFRRETALRVLIVCSLKVLAQKIQIKDPTDCTDNFDSDDGNDEVATVLDLRNYRPLVSAGRTVTFKLDDDSCVQADRELLGSKSDFFNQLLFGQFKESHEEVVRLSETPHGSLKLILMLLQRDDIASGDKLCRNGGELLGRVDLAVVLEAIALSDRFLLEQLSVSLTLFVQYCKFSPASAPIIYRWSVDSQTNILRVEIVAYCLVGCMSEKQRNRLFEELLKPQYSERLADDMKTMFRRFLFA